MKHIVYRSGYKHQLAEHYQDIVEIYPEREIKSEFYQLTPNGILLVKQGYAWDGASGPAIDTKDFMRGSLVHDVLYQMMGERQLELKWRKQADKELVRICGEDGMPFIRRQWVYSAVRLFSELSARPEGRRTIKKAP